MKNNPHFFYLSRFFSIFQQDPKTHCEADLAWRFFRLPSAMSILPISIRLCYEFDTI